MSEETKTPTPAPGCFDGPGAPSCYDGPGATVCYDPQEAEARKAREPLLAQLREAFDEAMGPGGHDPRGLRFAVDGLAEAVAGIDQATQGLTKASLQRMADIFADQRVLLADLLRARLELSLLADGADGAPEAENSENRAPHAEPDPIGSIDPQPKTASSAVPEPGPNPQVSDDWSRKIALEWAEQAVDHCAEAMETIGGTDEPDGQNMADLREDLLNLWQAVRHCKAHLEPVKGDES